MPFVGAGEVLIPSLVLDHKTRIGFWILLPTFETPPW